MFNPAALFTAPEHQPFLLAGSTDCAALLVHGFGGTPAEMRPLSDLLHAQGWTAQGLLLPGFGKDIATLGSVRPEQWNDAVSTALVALQRDYRRVVLVGFSMGGAIGVHVALETPPYALVLINPFTKIDNLVWRLLPVLKYAVRDFKPFRLIKVDFESEETKRNIAQFMPGADLSDPQVQEVVQSLSLPTSALDGLRSVGERAYARAAKLRVPTQVIQASRDSTASPVYSRKLAGRIPGAHLVEIDAEHNFVQYDPPRLRQAAEAILAFAERL